MKYKIEFVTYLRDDIGRSVCEKGNASLQIEATDFETADILAAAIVKSSQFDDYNVYELC